MTGRISFLIDGEAYLGRLIETINSAQHSADMRTYIFDNYDSPSTQLAEIIADEFL